MADDRDQANPVDQLIDLFVYAPIGLLYEYPEVLPKLVKRGRSQVQLAKVLGQLAIENRQSGGEGPPGDVATLITSLVARAITEFGAAVGLAPDQRPGEAGPAPSAGAPGSGEEAEGAPGPPGAAARASGAGEATAVAPPMPIANYDRLTAREIIPLLEALSPAQRQAVRDHERAGRSRKTVLAKLDRLDG